MPPLEHSRRPQAVRSARGTSRQRWRRWWLAPLLGLVPVLAAVLATQGVFFRAPSGSPIASGPQAASPVTASVPVSNSQSTPQQIGQPQPTAQAKPTSGATPAAQGAPAS